jgi:hypothetical protein
MSEIKQFLEAFEPSLAGRGTKWDLMECDKAPWAADYPALYRLGAGDSSPHSYSQDWMAQVPSLIIKVASEISDRRIELLVKDLQARLQKLEDGRPRIVPINTFAPEPYQLLRPIFVSVKAVEDEFEAGWFDANIHTAGENEEVAVSNLKSLILDYFDSLSQEPDEKLGIEPKRQLLVLKSFIKRES